MIHLTSMGEQLFVLNFNIPRKGPFVGGPHFWEVVYCWIFADLGPLEDRI